MSDCFDIQPPFPAEAYDRWKTTPPEDGPEVDDREPLDPDLEPDDYDTGSE